MDLGITGRKALVCGASSGLGLGCAQALADEGVQVVMVARRATVLQEAAERVAQSGNVEVATVCADVTTEAGRQAISAQHSSFDIVITNAGGPPLGDFRDWKRDDWIAAVDANMLTPIELIKSYVDGMIKQRFGRIVNITSSAVKAPIDALGLSNGARSGLTGFVAGLARRTVEHGVTINNLLPGSFDTPRLTSILAKQAQSAGVNVDELRERRIASQAAKRLGQPDEFGRACAFLCSAHAGYINGQNLLIDGGSYPGTF